MDDCRGDAPTMNGVFLWQVRIASRENGKKPADAREEPSAQKYKDVKKLRNSLAGGRKDD
jgi:hypothetical protein